MPETPKLAEEDRILRVWTPVILRATLITSAAILAAGLTKLAVESSGYYVARYHQMQNSGAVHKPEDWTQLAAGAMGGDAHAIMTIGLMVLTLVPLARVAFTFFFFVKERDGAFVIMTAYVLIALIAGVLLGRVG